MSSISSMIKVTEMTITTEERFSAAPDPRSASGFAPLEMVSSTETAFLESTSFTMQGIDRLLKAARNGGTLTFNRRKWLLDHFEMNMDRTKVVLRLHRHI